MLIINIIFVISCMIHYGNLIEIVVKFGWNVTNTIQDTSLEGWSI